MLGLADEVAVCIGFVLGFDREDCISFLSSTSLSITSRTRGLKFGLTFWSKTSSLGLTGMLGLVLKIMSVTSQIIPTIKEIVTIIANCFPFILVFQIVCLRAY